MCPTLLMGRMAAAKCLSSFSVGKQRTISITVAIDGTIYL